MKTPRTSSSSRGTPSWPRLIGRTLRATAHTASRRPASRACPLSRPQPIARWPEGNRARKSPSVIAPGLFIQISFTDGSDLRASEPGLHLLPSRKVPCRSQEAKDVVSRLFDQILAKHHVHRPALNGVLSGHLVEKLLQTVNRHVEHLVHEGRCAEGQGDLGNSLVGPLLMLPQDVPGMSLVGVTGPEWFLQAPAGPPSTPKKPGFARTC